MNKILLMTAIAIFAVLGAGSIPVVHASIIGNFGLGYCSGYVVGYDAEWERFNKHSHSAGQLGDT